MKKSKFQIKSCFVGLTLMIIFAISTFSPCIYAKSLVFYSSLDSQSAIENPEIGLGGEFNASIDNFVEGVKGQAYTANHTENKLVTFPKEVIPIGAGTIECYVKISGFSSTIYNGSYPYFFNIDDGTVEYEMGFNANDGHGCGGLVGAVGYGLDVGTGNNGSWTYEQILGIGQVESWHHYALIWDGNGIEGLGNGRMQCAVFLDGKFNSTFGISEDGTLDALNNSSLGLIVINGNQSGRSVAIDEFKIWDYAKTEFNLVDDDPIAWYTFDDSSDVGKDSSGNNHNGANNGVQYQADGVVGGCSYYAGSGQFISVPDHDDLDLTTLTVSYWLKVPSIDYISGKNRTFGKYLNSGGYRRGWIEYLHPDNAISVAVGQGYESENRVLTKENVNATNWVHVAHTITSYTSKLYVNGELCDSNSWVIPSVLTNEAPLTLGGYEASGWAWLLGWLDEVKIWNRALSSEEIAKEAGIKSNECNLIAYYPFNGNANDESGNGHDGTVNGATLTTDRLGNPNSAYRFDGGQINGNGDYIEVSNSLSLNNLEEISVAFWTKRFTEIGDYSRILGKYSNDLEAGWLFDWRGLGRSEIGFNIGNGEVISGGNISTGEWAHVVGTYDGTTKKLYINGNLAAQNQSTGGENLNANVNFDIGRFLAWGIAYYKGETDEVRIYNCALSDCEIQELYGNAENPAVLTLSLADGQVGSIYSATLEAIAGAKPYIWSISSGQLPPGILLDTTGELSGTPTSTGIYSFVARVTDAGNDFDEAILSISVNDIESAEWYEITSSAPWTGRHGHSCTEFKGKIWLLGGLSSSTYNNEIWSSPDGTNWTLEGEADWSKRGYHTTTVFDNKLWVFGGNNPSAGKLNDVWSSSDGVNWTLVTSGASWSTRSGAKSFVYNDKLWIVGGMHVDKTEFCDDVWSSVDGTNWMQVTSSAPWGERGYHESFVFKEKMWVVGGVCGRWVDYSKDVWSSTDGTNWTLVTADATCAERHYTSAVVLDDKIWICGSYHHGEQNDVWSSPNGSDWTLETEHATWPDRCAQSVFVFGNELWIAGGEGRHNRQLNDVWCSAPFLPINPTNSSNLIAYYPYNGNANDESGNNHDGTVNGATLTTDRFGNENSAYSFDGTIKYITVPSKSEWEFGANDVTISVWFKGSAQSSSWPPTFISQWNCGSYEGNWILGLDHNGSGKVVFYWQKHHYNSPFLISDKSITDDNWHNIILMRKNGDVKIYIDAELEISNSDYINSIFGNGELDIYKGTYECRLDDTSASVIGSLDDVSIYNCALSENEIKKLYGEKQCNLIAYYPFNGNANDESGNGNNGTVHGATLTTDRLGNLNSAYRFDGGQINGNGDYIEVLNSSSLNNLEKISVAFWTKRFTEIGDYSRILGKYSNDLDAGWKFDWAGAGRNAINFSIANGDVLAGGNIPTNEWVHVAGTYDGTTKKIYINGELISLNQSTGSENLNANVNFDIGRFLAWGIAYYKGEIDEVKVWNCALSAEEIAKEAGVKTNECNLIAYYPFDGNANDESGNENNGTISGATLTTDKDGNANKAYSFDGNDYIEVSYSQELAPSTEVTFSTWAYRLDWSTFSKEKILSKTHAGGYSLGADSYDVPIGNIGVQVFRNNKYGSPQISASTLDSGWHHFVGTYDGRYTKFYVDGLLKATDDAGANYPMQYDYICSLIIGSEADEIAGQQQWYFNGKIDDVRIYGCALSAEEIAKLYGGGSTQVQDIAILTFSLPEGYENQSYSAVLQAEGGIAPYEWNINSGSLPNGLGLSFDGSITGSPIASGSYNFNLRVTDSADKYKEKDFSILVNESSWDGLEITTLALPSVLVGEKYYVEIKAVGGTTPYIWEIENGELPEGISLISTHGILTGNPTQKEDAFFVIKVTDKAGLTHSMPLVINVNEDGEQNLNIQNVSKAKFIINWRKHIKNNLDDVDCVWLRMLFEVPEGFTLTEGLPVTAFFGAYPIDGYEAVISPNGKRAIYREGSKADDEYPIVKMVLRIKKKGNKEIGLLYAVAKFADLYGELGAPNEDIENGKITIPIEMLLGTYEGSKSIEMLYNSKKDRKAKGNYPIRK